MDSSRGTLNCDATSLLNLKAELYRKQEACKLAKACQNFGPLKRMTIKGQTVTVKKDKKIPETTEIPKDDHEEEMLQKSRMILEAKAKIYDQIVEKKVALDEDFGDNYLVDFQRKELFGHSAAAKGSDSKPNDCNSEKESIPSDNLTSQKNFEFSVTTSADHQPQDVETQSSFSDNPLQKEVDAATEDQTTDGPVHYQNVRYNEIRDHGVGYFGFSQEQKTREEQMELLKTLRQETIESKQTKEKLKQKKQALLQARLAKVCQRRNIDSSVLQEYTSKEDKLPEDAEPEHVSDSQTDHPSNSTEPASDSAQPSKKIRPWDIGKSNFDLPTQTSKKKLSGAEKWLEHKREERNEEFAPPSIYFNNSEPTAKKFRQNN